MASAAAMRKYQSWVQQQTATTGRAPSEAERRRMLQTFLEQEQVAQSQSQQLGLQVKASDRADKAQEIQQSQFAESSDTQRTQFDRSATLQAQRDADAASAARVSGISNLALTGLVLSGTDLGKSMGKGVKGLYNRALGRTTPEPALTADPTIEGYTVPETPAFESTQFGQTAGGTTQAPAVADLGSVYTAPTFTPTYFGGEAAAAEGASFGTGGTYSLGVAGPGATPVAAGEGASFGAGAGGSQSYSLGVAGPGETAPAATGGWTANPYVQGAGSAALSGTAGRYVSQNETALSLAQLPAGQRLNQNQAAIVAGGGTGAIIGGPIGAGVGAYAAYRQQTGGEGSGGGFGGEVVAIPGDVLGIKEPGEWSRKAGEFLDSAMPEEISGTFNSVFDFFTGGTWYCTEVDRTVGLSDEDHATLRDFFRYSMKNHRDVVKYYLRKGPEVVKFIRESHEEDTPQVFKEMNETLVQPTIEHMKAGESEKAYRHYADFNDKLIHDYTPHLVEEWTMIYRNDTDLLQKTG